MTETVFSSLKLPSPSQLLDIYWFCNNILIFAKQMSDALWNTRW